MNICTIENFDRQEYYNYYRQQSCQYHSANFEVEITNLYNGAKAKKWPLYLATVWAVATAVNNIKALRQRLFLDDTGKEAVIEYVLTHPSFTVPAINGYFNFCLVEYLPKLTDFCARAKPMAELAQNSRQFDNYSKNREDVMHLSCIPNLPFTSVNSLLLPKNFDELPITAPMIVWGKISPRENKWVMPMSIQVNHIFCDGKHLGDFYQELHEILAGFKSN